RLYCPAPLSSPCPPPPASTLFPYTTLFRSVLGRALAQLPTRRRRCPELLLCRRNRRGAPRSRTPGRRRLALVPSGAERRAGDGRDRKSTRLNSSHDQISYAVFCLKKKTTDA